MLSRGEQIGQLLSFYPVARQAADDPNAWEIGLALSAQGPFAGKILTVRVMLPPGFPEGGIRPMMRIMDQGARHAIINADGFVVGAPELSAWDPRRGNLGTAVSAVMNKLTAVPPTLAYPPPQQQQQQQQHQGPPGGMGIGPAGMMGGMQGQHMGQMPNQQQHQQQQQQQARPPMGGAAGGMPGQQQPQPQLPKQAIIRMDSSDGSSGGLVSTSSSSSATKTHKAHTGLPEIPHHFAELESLGLGELEELLSNSEARSAWVASLETAMIFETLVSSQRDKVKQLATDGLDKQQSIKTVSEQLSNAQAVAVSKHEELLRLKQQQREQMEQFSAGRLAKELDTVAKETSKRADALARNFCEGTGGAGSNSSWREFREDYFSLEKRHHAAAAKARLVQAAGLHSPLRTS